MQLLPYTLVFLCLSLTIYDFWYRRVPNEITFPLILIGILANFPGVPTLWLGSILLFIAWGSGWMGGGDVKLWMGLLWCTFSFWGDNVTLVMFITLIVTGLVQILMRVFIKNKEIVGIKSPGAWRAFAYCVFLLLYPAGGFSYVNI